MLAMSLLPAQAVTEGKSASNAAADHQCRTRIYPAPHQRCRMRQRVCHEITPVDLSASVTWDGAGTTVTIA
ncbi:hypothetical protein GCM10010140_64400 [Streptosporangium pseudovulgare]|uniref:Uncharacterized protein n=1 Tax=Streptosporangium pseudovulgare TaxID=35765 RepID=A0ABQ2RFH8_9ACTN|nr:hypothetical protein GCM10010140_64400 [Streptosporangium pseudovulgare]